MNDRLGHSPNYEWDIARCDLRQWPDDGHSAKVGKRRCVWIMNWPSLYVTVVPHVWCCWWCGTLISGWWFWRYPLLLHCNPSFPFKKQVIKRKIDREIWDQSWPNWEIGISIRDFASPCLCFPQKSSRFSHYFRRKRGNDDMDRVVLFATRKWGRVHRSAGFHLYVVPSRCYRF